MLYPLNRLKNPEPVLRGYVPLVRPTRPAEKWLAVEGQLYRKCPDQSHYQHVSVGSDSSALAVDLADFTTAGHADLLIAQALGYGATAAHLGVHPRGWFLREGSRLIVLSGRYAKGPASDALLAARDAVKKIRPRAENLPIARGALLEALFGLTSVP